MTARIGAKALADCLRLFRVAAVCILLSAALIACTSVGGDSPNEERVRVLEAKVSSLEESVQELTSQNAGLEDEISVLRQEQADFVEAQEAAGADREHEAGQEERLSAVDARLHEVEEIVLDIESVISTKEEWSDKGEKETSSPEGTPLERTVKLVEEYGEVHYVGHDGRNDRTILVTPLDFVDDETPLIVSLHGFGGDSAYQAAYVPLHERVNSQGFALLLPNGIPDSEGNRFWNPTDHCCDGGKSGEDDIAFLAELVAEAERVKDFGPVYFFGYSNGGFMSYHIACKGLPGLRAVVSLAGTSYVEDSSCEGAPPVSVLHIHGTADSVILFEGNESEADPKSDGDRAFYAGAEEMVTRWSHRAGCDWSQGLGPYATLDLDQYVSGAETQAFRTGSDCAEGVQVELWKGVGSGHSPGYGEAFVDELVAWLLSQD